MKTHESSKINKFCALYCITATKGIQRRSFNLLLPTYWFVYIAHIWYCHSIGAKVSIMHYASVCFAFLTVRQRVSSTLKPKVNSTKPQSSVRIRWATRQRPNISRNFAVSLRRRSPAPSCCRPGTLDKRLSSYLSLRCRFQLLLCAEVFLRGDAPRCRSLANTVALGRVICCGDDYLRHLATILRIRRVNALRELELEQSFAFWSKQVFLILDREWRI